MLNVLIGPHGEIKQAAAIVYGRRAAEPGLPATVTDAQARSYVSYTEATFTPDIDETVPVPAYRLGIPYDTISFDVTGVNTSLSLVLRDDLAGDLATGTDVDFEEVAAGPGVEKRLVGRSRIRFRDNALNPLPFGTWDSRGMPFESYELALTHGLAAAQYAGQVADAELTAAGYVQLGGADWWIPSGVSIYPASAASHFFVSTGSRDALGQETSATFDADDLLVERWAVVGAQWDVVTAVNDYRTLGPVLTTDQNGNRTAVEVDALGLVTRTAVMGKAGAGVGDTLADPTTRIEYDLFSWMNSQEPVVAHALARERHGAANPRWQESYAYSDGHGRRAMLKTQAPPGKAFAWQPDGSVVEIDADPRWVGSGRTVVNNKGMPVKQYQPFYAVDHRYDRLEAMARIGVTPISTYDALGRPVRVDHPDGTFARVEVTSWATRQFDQNDTVLDSQWFADRGSPDPGTEPEPLLDLDRRSAWLAAHHANTPSRTDTDALGRPIRFVSDHGGGQVAGVRAERDATGARSALFDEFDRRVAETIETPTGATIYASSAERGARWSVVDALGGLVRAWDNHGRSFRAEYDLLHRPVATYVSEGGQPERLFDFVVYGDQHPNAVAGNLLGAAHQVFDTAGMLRVVSRDLLGNAACVERVLALDPTAPPDWSTLRSQASYAAIQAAAGPFLAAADTFRVVSEHDALGRPVQMVLHEGTILTPGYDEANRMTSMRVQVHGQGASVNVLEGRDYDALGRHLESRYGNNTRTRSTYDPLSLLAIGQVAGPAAPGPGGPFQDLHYSYDPVGNVTAVRDAAQQTHVFANAVVRAEWRYRYDAMYQLTSASGREHAGSANDNIRDRADLDYVPQVPHINDANAVRNYEEAYTYDLAGNILELRHSAAAGVASWRRRYRYRYQDDPSDSTNRLATTSRPGDPAAGPYSAVYAYDAAGNMTGPGRANPNEFAWDSMDRMATVDLGGGGIARYIYDAAGARVRKVIEQIGGVRVERIYLGMTELYRETPAGAAAPRLARETIHLVAADGPFAQIDIKTADQAGADPDNPLGVPLLRYQYRDQVGSTVLEADSGGGVIAHEEYHPFGTTAYRSAKAGSDVSLKRYRFAGRERDDETGLYHFPARPYAPWLGRWISPDPAGFVSTPNLFAYCRNSPTSRVDPAGFDDYQCVLVLGQGGFIPMDLAPGGCYRALQQGRINPTTIAPGALPQPPPVARPVARPPARSGGGGRGGSRASGHSGGGAGATHPVPPSGGGDNPPPPPPPPPVPPATDGPGSGGSSTQQGPPPPPPASSGGDNTGAAPAPGAGRSILEEVARPSSITGARPRGTLHLWSGDGKGEAQAAIARDKSGWMMGDIEGQPTPEHAAGEAEFARARAGAPGGRLPQSEVDRIWGGRSASVVGRGAFAGHPVEAHGVPAAQSIQPRYEWPARAWGGGIRGGFAFGTGLFSAVTGGQDPNPWVATSLVIAGVGEATSGLIYGSGAILGATEAMAIGTAGVTAFGGAGAAIGFGTQSYRKFRAGDTTGGVVNALGALGGLLMIASLFTPVGWVGLLGVGLVGFASGYNFAEWLSR